MLKHNASVSARSLDRLAVNEDLARSRKTDALQNAQQGAFFFFFLPDHADELTLLNGRADFLQGSKAVFLFGVING